MTNVGDDELLTGSRGHIDIQYRGEDGWHSIFGAEGRAVWPDIGVFHRPGEGFRWRVPFTRDGLAEPVESTPPLVVCNPLDAGMYRFVYWGLVTDDEDSASSPALGVTFEASTK